MSQVILNDQEILDQTTQKTEGGYLQFSFTTPGKDGRTISSEKMPKASVNSQALIAWCESIRQQMEVDYNATRKEMEAKRKARIKAEDEAAPGSDAKGTLKYEGCRTGMGTPGGKEAENLIHAGWGTSTPIPGRIIHPEQATTAVIAQPDLWQTYGQLLGELEKIKAQLRAAGEQI